MPDPKKIKERLFSGRIWVDDQDLQIVKTKGKGVPETKNNKFPTVETYREHIDGQFLVSYLFICRRGTDIRQWWLAPCADESSLYGLHPHPSTLKVTEIGENETPSGDRATKAGRGR